VFIDDMNGIAVARPTACGVRTAAAQCRVQVQAFDLGLAALAATLIPVSLIWDFSWESTIGVDRFWSPPHLTTHIGVWLCGLLGARLVFVFTLTHHQGGSVSGVNIGGFCGPSGAWILLWGAVVMQAALLLDNWWQQAYGLGAGLWPPPQILKAIGFFTLLFGGVVLCAGARGHGVASRRTMAAVLLHWQGGLLLTMCAVVLTMLNYPNWQHTAGFYKISCAIYPAVLLAMGTGASGRWGATCTAVVYMAIVCALVWLLPLFPARPLTAPIHNPTDHMMPPAFPLLLVVPVVVMDWLRGRSVLLPGCEAATNQPTPNPSQEGNNPSCAAPLLGGGRGGFKRTNRELWVAVTAGTCFVAAFVPVQWFFAKFLLSPGTDNWFFAGGGRHWPFFLKIDQARTAFWGVKQEPLTWQAALLAMLFAGVSSWIGLRVGTWLSKLRR